jgi:hypothetical protein
LEKSTFPKICTSIERIYLYLVYCNKPSDKYKNEVYFTINRSNIFSLDPPQDKVSHPLLKICQSCFMFKYIVLYHSFLIFGILYISICLIVFIFYLVFWDNSVILWRRNLRFGYFYSSFSIFFFKKLINSKKSGCEGQLSEMNILCLQNPLNFHWVPVLRLWLSLVQTHYNN